MTAHCRPRHRPLAGVARGEDLALDAAVAETTWNDHALDSGQQVVDRILR
jgi:hypothetical protein